MSKELAVDTSKQTINSGYLEFYELQVGAGSVSTLYFHPGTNENAEDITYDGQTYISIPLMLTGVQVQASGTVARPTITIANVESILKSQSVFKTEMRESDWNATVNSLPVTNSNFKLDDLIGSRLTRRRTLEKYLNSNPTIEFTKDTYIIDRISNKTNTFVTFELSAPHDLQGFRLPARNVVGKYCPWKYQGASTELLASDRQGACVWKKSGQINLGTNTASVFNTEDDEPLVLAPALASASAGTYSSSTSYALDAIVLQSGIYYQSQSASNQGNAVTNPVFWRILRAYTIWDTDGSTSYTVDATDRRKNSYVRHDNTIWRNLIAHTRNSNFEPELGSTHWERADVCGKLIKSCKQRYQAKGINNNIGGNFIPSTESATQAVLPFGGFPGSRKFR